MSEDKKQSTLTIRILGRDYPVSCPDDEREVLLASAERLSKRMQSIQKKGKTLGADRIAVMAALNTTRELLSLERDMAQLRTRMQDDDSLVGAAHGAQQGSGPGEYDQRLAQLQSRIDSALDDPA